jgi:hypothetical protein
MSTPNANAADVHDQDTPLLEEPPEADGTLEDDTPEADAAEQRVEVALDEEDAPIG